MTPEQQYVDELKRSYQMAFGSPAGQKVLKDLAKFCFVSTAEGPYARGDANETMFRLGCQEVFRYIGLYLDRTTENLVSLYFPHEDKKR